MTRWGKAGQRLTEAEAAQRDYGVRSRLNRTTADRERQERDAKMRWAAGKVVPAHITRALDLLELYGPEVDRTCGVQEPAVDQWEAGLLYPTWDQLRALAELTGRPVGYFVMDSIAIDPARTSMRFHDRTLMQDPGLPPVLRYTEAALAAARLTEAPV